MSIDELHLKLTEEGMSNCFKDFYLFGAIMKEIESPLNDYWSLQERAAVAKLLKYARRKLKENEREQNSTPS